MKRNRVRMVLFFAMIFLGLAAVAAAKDHGVCSPAAVAGEWGHSFTGTLILPTGMVPFAAVGRATIDATGNASGTQHSSRGGVVAEETLKGTLSVSADCTGTLTVGIYDQSGTLLRTAIWAVVLVDNATEFRAILTSLTVQPSGMSVPTVITLEAKRLFRGHREGREE